MKFWFTSCGFNDLWNVPHVINLIIMDDNDNPDHPEWQWQITNSKCDHPFFRWSIEIDQLLCSEQVHILCVLQLFKCYVSKCDQSLFFLRWSIEKALRQKIEATFDESQMTMKAVYWSVDLWHCWQHVTSNQDIDESEVKNWNLTCCWTLETEGQLSQRSPTPSPSVSFWSYCNLVFWYYQHN